ncbi:heavy-metal-associated domain-containing protein [Pontibacter arcticus]|uniref:HMA domain-containing protein n=1 Tax=Pontibacter arcticus TaxID=2080288 RepID=A0A364RBY5_9BACT|nr:heavy-metal-associated domain-containing protein [Pontibacter arcticus]RAU81803.1 hypothetical protein DP923_13985 [Pontibacter arcticus]
MKDLKFKTNINCGGCIEKVTPVLDNTQGIAEWAVDTAVKEKILTVKTDSLSENEVIAVVEKAGFKAQTL